MIWFWSAIMLYLIFIQVLSITYKCFIKTLGSCFWVLFLKITDFLMLRSKLLCTFFSSGEAALWNFEFHCIRQYPLLIFTFYKLILVQSWLKIEYIISFFNKHMHSVMWRNVNGISIFILVLKLSNAAFFHLSSHIDRKFSENCGQT